MKGRKEILNGIKRAQSQASYWRNKPYDTMDERTAYRESIKFREGVASGLRWALEK